MVASSHRDEIDESSKVLKAFRRSSELFANEKEILGLEKQRYILYYSQIHEVLAPRRRDEGESEILELIRQIYGLDIPVCEAKIKRFQDGLEKCERTGNDRYINNYYAYLQEWLGLYESFYALIAFRSFEHFAIFMEWDKSESEKVWAPSLDPYHDNGYTGVSKPFFYFFNQMVLGKKIKFISKQMFTGAGKCVVPTTEVLTPSGTRMIKDINVGDYVYSMKDNEICERRVTNKWFSKKKQVTLTTRGGEEITVSPEHKMLTQRGYVMASEITENDYLYRLCATYKKTIVEEHYRQTGEFADIIYKDFVWERIKKIEYCEEITDMIDIEVEETHNFIANHLVSHNSFSNQYAFAWLLGIDKNVDILDVVGNPSNVLPNTSGTVDLMINPRYARVFPEYAQFFGEEYNADAVREAMFATCKINMGEIKVTGSRKINLRVCSKDKKVNGVRCKFLFLDDICQSEDSANLKAHQEDINRFWKDWFRRQYNNVDFYIVVSGTAYSVNDIMSHLIGYYSKGKMFRTKENKYTYASQDGTAIFIKIPKIDEDFDRSTYPQKFPYEEAIKLRDLDLNTFLAMEQQRPQNPETSPLSYDKINTYEELPTGLSEGAFACLDPARTGKNFVTMGIHRIKIEVDKFNAQVEKHYFVDCVFQLKQMADLYETICEKVIRHHIIKLHIENNTDTSLAYLIEKMLHEKGIFFCEISEVFSRENKEEKIRELVYGNEGYFKNQMVYPALNLYAPSSEIGKFMLYLTGYDYYKKQEYDDSIDEECMYIKKFLAKSKDRPKAKILYV